MSTLRRQPQQAETLEDRAVAARQTWWTTTTRRAGITLVDSAFRFAVAEINREKLPITRPDEIRQRAERLLLELRSQGLMVRSADEIRYFYTHAKRELDLARLSVGKFPARPARGALDMPDQVNDSASPSGTQEAIGSLVARLLTQPGLDAITRLAQTLSTIGGSEPFKAEKLALEAIDPQAQTITLSISDTVEFQRICSALRQAEPAWGMSAGVADEPGM